MCDDGSLLFAIGTIVLCIGLPVLVSVLYRGKNHV